MLAKNLGNGKNRLIGMVGRKGSGKTTKLCSLLSQPEYGNRVVLVDPPGNIDFGVTVEDLHSMEAMLNRQEKKKFRLRFTDICAIGSRMEGDYDPDYWAIEAIAQMAIDTGDCTLAIDEIDMFCNPYTIPPTLRRLLARGRHDRVNLLWTARRPQEVSKLLLAQSDEFFLFQTHHPADVQYFSQFMAFEKDDVLKLSVGNSIHWTAGSSGAMLNS